MRGRAPVYVVNEEERAILHPVRGGRTIGNRVLIEDGLQPGYRVVVEGFQKFTPGARVKAAPWTEETPAKVVSN